MSTHEKGSDIHTDMTKQMTRNEHTHYQAVNKFTQLIELRAVYLQSVDNMDI